MFQQFAPGIYYPVDSVLHRLGARTKLLALIWLIGFATAANQLGRAAPYLAMAGLTLVAGALSGVGLAHLWRRMRLLALLTLLGTFPAMLLLEGDGTPILELGPLAITDMAVRLGVQLVVVFLALYALALLLTMTTKPVALIDGLTLLLGPLRWLRLPVDAFALMALLALRFTPTLAEEIELLIKAQLSRGASFTQGGLRQRLNSISTLVVPVFGGTLRRAADLATALDARGYTVDQAPTTLHERQLGRADYLALALVLAVTLGSLWL